MKTLILASWLVIAGTLSAAAQSSNLVTVDVDVNTEHNDPKDSITEVVNKTLGIRLSGAPSITGELRVVSVLYARDLKARETVVEKRTESKATLDSNHSASLTPPSVTFTSTPSTSKKTGRGRSAKSVRVEATGRHYYGWTVQVFQGDKLLGNAASSTTLKEN